jgi:UDP-glucose 4-epimerase
MRILITGSSGRVGRAIYQRLCVEHSVLGLDQSPSSTADRVVDICDAQALRAALVGADAVIHTAALHAPHVGHFSNQRFIDVNVCATEQLAELAIAAGVRRMVFTSTTALYGAACEQADRAVWIDERTQAEPRSIYHRSKLEAEARLDAIAAHGDIKVTVLRMSRCFPEPAPVMAAFRLHRGIDVRDVADAHAIAASDETNQPFRRFVISGSTPFRPDDCDALRHNAAECIRTRCPELARAFTQRGWALPTTIDRVYVSRNAEAQWSWRSRFGFEEVLAQLDRRSLEVLPVRATWLVSE